MKQHYLLPPEWSPQLAVMLIWPHHQHSDWLPLLQDVESVYIDIIRHISHFEPVLIISYDKTHTHHISTLLTKNGISQRNISFCCARSNDTWIRDHGPVTVLDQRDRPRLLDFTFNAWGGKYNAELDNRLTRRLHEQNIFGDIPLEVVDLVLEGGAIDVDGQGSLLTTTRCLLSPLRNPDIGCQTLEAIFEKLFGVKRTLWLEHGHLAGDDTDSHIDTLVRFCNPSTITYTACDDPQDEHYHELKEMEAELKTFRDANNKPYHLLPLPWPEPQYNQSGQRLPTTYANFLIINGAVLVPVYGISSDEQAITVLHGCFPERKIIAVNCTPLIHQYGSLHCITMQIPKKP